METSVRSSASQNEASPYFLFLWQVHNDVRAGVLFILRQRPRRPPTKEEIGDSFDEKDSFPANTQDGAQEGKQVVGGSFPLFHGFSSITYTRLRSLVPRPARVGYWTKAHSWIIACTPSGFRCSAVDAFCTVIYNIEVVRLATSMESKPVSSSGE